MGDIEKFEDFLFLQHQIDLDKFFSNLDSSKFSDSEKNNILQILQKNCPFFLNELRSIKSRFLFRGVIGGWTELSRGIYRKNVRRDRQPRDTSNEFSQLFDDVFEDEFGVKIRSEGFTVTKDPLVARSYSQNVFLFFPIGSYRYFWNSTVIDLWKHIREEDWYWDDYSNNHQNYISQVSQLVAGYEEGGLEHVRDQEINFFCNSYLLVDVDLLPFLEENL